MTFHRLGGFSPADLALPQKEKMAELFVFRFEAGFATSDLTWRWVFL